MSNVADRSSIEDLELSFGISSLLEMLTTETLVRFTGEKID
jgi:hypothetical protein